MLRRIPPTMSLPRFVDILAEMAPGPYDFVYLPQDRNRNVSIGLAWVNFVDHDSAARAFQEFQSWTHEGSERNGFDSNVEVRSANIQGRAANLAYFLARFGFGALHHADSSLIVLKDGRPAPNLIQAVKECVAPSLLKEAKELVAAEWDGSTAKPGRHGFGRRKQGFLWNPRLPDGVKGIPDSVAHGACQGEVQHGTARASDNFIVQNGWISMHNNLASQSGDLIFSL